MVFDVVSKPVHIGSYFLISSKYAIAFVYSGLQCLAPAWGACTAVVVIAGLL